MDIFSALITPFLWIFFGIPFVYSYIIYHIIFFILFLLIRAKERTEEQVPPFQGLRLTSRERDRAVGSHPAVGLPSPALLAKFALPIFSFLPEKACDGGPSTYYHFLLIYDIAPNFYHVFLSKDEKAHIVKHWGKTMTFIGGR
jgi:hypothetical protein